MSVEVEAVAAFEHYVGRKPGDRFVVSEQQAVELERARLVKRVAKSVPKSKTKSKEKSQ